MVAVAMARLAGRLEGAILVMSRTEAEQFLHWKGFLKRQRRGPLHHRPAAGGPPPHDRFAATGRICELPKSSPSAKPMGRWQTPQAADGGAAQGRQRRGPLHLP